MPAVRMPDWRSFPARILHVWRASLQFRTVAITVVLSALAVAILGTYMSISIGGNLFDSRLKQVLAESSRATEQAQNVFDSDLATADPSRTDLEYLSASVQSTIRSSTTSPGGLGVAIYRTPGQQTPVTMQPGQSRGFPDYVLSSELQAAVEGNRGAERVWWQSVELNDGRPAIAVGSLLTVPNAGFYELYLVYDLGDAQQTLSFVQQTLLLGGLALVLLIGAVTYIVVRLVVGPVRVAAEVSEKLAAGQLEQRIPEKGEDVIATLARSFNGMADSLQEQITKLGELSRLQQRFVADVSHELRTPLTTIRLAGDVLYDQRETFPAATARTAELLHTQVQRFEILLADLLEVSRFDAGAVELEVEPTNLVRLVEDAADSMRLVASERGSDIRVVAAGGYFDVEVDARRIRRILRNILGNAIEHGEGKPIVVSVDSNEDAVALAVRDHGIGIATDDLTRVFDRFWRADPSRQRTIGGTGLGLAISLEDTSLHRGYLDVWSEPGNGTCFRLTLPRDLERSIRVSPIDLPPAEPTDDLGVNDDWTNKWEA
ncbi:two-component system sensor histidine kinase MtrB [Cryobacterium mesophilum]|uniref:Sensor histidine kinase MtrB n=1 Tax=Terrimesophilobacter mesophilus TaxID=433647 RepID=A0A4R8VC76_9MICO|nr:MtrAB system histidine kinase MtrB [Terrimesophilobacter mesophilus]MBB5632624.1 two-component system sensor histidine kinase MtrB [Terrimesophilobacter mesophilus]TFB79437.1 HAMP domain-containing histidine kinase [Terrimesophilobacter mesophilus]